MPVVRRCIVVRLLGFQLAAEVGQFLDEDGFRQRQQRTYFGVAQVVLAFHLRLTQVAEKQTLLHLVVALPQVALQQLPQHLHSFALHSPLSTLYSFQLFLQHLLLLANHVVVVQHPLVGAAHKTLVPCFLHQQHIIACDLFYALFECLVSLFHRVYINMQSAKIQTFFEL